MKFTIIGSKEADLDKPVVQAKQFEVFTLSGQATFYTGQLVFFGAVPGLGFEGYEILGPSEECFGVASLEPGEKRLDIKFRCKLIMAYKHRKCRTCELGDVILIPGSVLGSRVLARERQRNQSGGGRLQSPSLSKQNRPLHKLRADLI